jgi:GR25 family glycosyltransferase involved in LPS biosynthesis
MSVSSAPLIKSIEDIKYCLYINLASRPDRKIHIEGQLRGIGLNPTRFNAIKLKNGRIGCSMSHLKCLQIAKNNNWPYVMICEDDLLILNNETFVTHINRFFRMHGDESSHNKWNVLLLAGNNVPPYKKIDDTCIQVSHCQTTTGYLVNGHYIEKLLNNIKMGLTNLIKEPQNHAKYAIDKYWFSLQKTDKWFLITPLTVVQREDYSDIEKKVINYQEIMTDLDKTELFERVRIYKEQQQKQHLEQQKYQEMMSKFRGRMNII